MQLIEPATNKESSTVLETGLRSDPRKAWAERVVQILATAALFAAPALMCLYTASLKDPDIWWHLRVGEWIVQHHAILRSDIFSRELAGAPWLSYSWLFEVAVFKIYQCFGVAGILGYSTGMVLAITIALNHMIRRLQADFTFSLLLTYLACLSFGHLYTPRPWMLSILFFILEVDILMHARKTGRLRELAWLPLIFALWANVHIEFVYGLFAVGLVLLESIAARWRSKEADSVPLLSACCVLLASSLATLVNPFGWHIYEVVYNLVTQGGGLKQVSEMQSIAFRDFLDYLVLALTIASVGALAWSRRFRIFECGLLLFAVFMAFREQRDVWLISVVATALLAFAIPSRKNLAVIQLPKLATALEAAIAVGMLMAASSVLKVNKPLLDGKVAAALPVDAVRVIQQKGYAGPVFNDFNWGGYLIWALREPVTIDGRTNLYGNERMDRSIATWGANANWSNDPELRSSAVVIGPVQYPLVQVLRLEPDFQLVYEDKVAAVFIRRK